jgi:16S rRNA (cytidine1402-2'-O)-methyltransferase
MSTLFLVATPIGNLEDLSPRAQRVLREVKLIAAEDTRHSGKLLKQFDIHTPLTSYFEHNERLKLDEILSALEYGDIALISDAGMPGINDPGFLLVRAALDAGHQVSPVPGPSAPISALAASGLPTDQFLYLGYPARKSSERKKEFEAVAALPYTLIILESPHRLLDTLTDLHETFGDRQVCVAAELTKMYERFFRGTLSEATRFYESEPARGEFTIIVAGMQPEGKRWSEERVKEVLRDRNPSKGPPSQLARQVAKDAGWARGAVYDLIQKMNKEAK